MTHRNTINDRIRDRLTALGLSPRAASLKAGLSTHFLQRVLARDDVSMTVENLLRLSEALETSAEWLLTGAIPGTPPPGTQQLFDIYLQMSPAERKTLLDFAQWTLRNQR